MRKVTTLACAILYLVLGVLAIQSTHGPNVCSMEHAAVEMVADRLVGVTAE